ncbi:MAG: hypothetical protein L7V85_07065 [Bacteroidia bacterium]|nr:hypothetical protein [Bacteroidia bacterium]
MMKELTRRERKGLRIDVDKSELEDIVSFVLARKGLSNEQKIDRLLFYDHTLHGNLDITNHQKDKKKVMLRSRIIYRAIKTLDKTLGDVFLAHQDDA